MNISGKCTSCGWRTHHRQWRLSYLRGVQYNEPGVWLCWECEAPPLEHNRQEPWALAPGWELIIRVGLRDEDYYQPRLRYAAQQRALMALEDAAELIPGTFEGDWQANPRRREWEYIAISLAYSNWTPPQALFSDRMREVDPSGDLLQADLAGHEMDDALRAPPVSGADLTVDMMLDAIEQMELAELHEPDR